MFDPRIFLQSEYKRKAFSTLQGLTDIFSCLLSHIFLSIVIKRLLSFQSSCEKYRDKCRNNFKNCIVLFILLSQLIPLYTTLNFFKHSYFPRAIRGWSLLPGDLKAIAEIGLFKKKLRKYFLEPLNDYISP